MTLGTSRAYRIALGPSEGASRSLETPTVNGPSPAPITLTMSATTAAASARMRTWQAFV